MKKFDLTTIIGIIVGIILLTLAIVVAGGSDSKIFISLSSFLTVMGGLIASLLINFNVSNFKQSYLSIKQTFKENQYDMNHLVDQFVELSTMARREGLLSLDRVVDDLEDPFIKKGIQLTVDGLEAEVIKEILMAEIISLEEKENTGRAVLEKAGEMAPAWGMVGTLIGLILMLQNLDDPKTIGPSMALALITTFYGSVLANLLFIPLAGKVKLRTDLNLFVKQVIIEGILGVQSGQNPKLLREKLQVFVEQKKSKQVDESAVINEEVASGV